MSDYTFFNRDLSWLTFNQRVLEEAARPEVPLMEKIRFLSIYSSNLDEFYRVRMPVLKVLDRNIDIQPVESAYRVAKKHINRQQQRYGEILQSIIIPELAAANYNWLYRKPFPESISTIVREIFNNTVRPLLTPVYIEPENTSFFAENNRLYLAIILGNKQDETEKLVMLNIPSDTLPRLYSIPDGKLKHILFLDDIIRYNLQQLFADNIVKGAYAVKVTRDAELHLEEEIDEHIITAMEKELAKRDFGIATRLLFQPDLPLRHLHKMVHALNLQHAAMVMGGYYHNLKDLNNFPLTESQYAYPDWPAIKTTRQMEERSIFDRILEKDILINLPYQGFDAIIEFFESAAADPQVTEIYCTLYRVAKDSRVVNALITAAQQQKKVLVMFELKARFDEENNIKWATKLKAAGAEVIYSSVRYKVHAKVALVKRSDGAALQYFGLLSTGNLNENTAKFYTDHALLTSEPGLLRELESLFKFMAVPKKTQEIKDSVAFKGLLVAQFNLQDQFLWLIEREIQHAQSGLPAAITIKLNNLEEKTLISKLYDASNAGVRINLIIRSICCLVPGIPGQSENISIIRIVDRYLEHGRIFIFHNNGNKSIYMGSADWMNRNIYSRIEVCFPIQDPEVRAMIFKLVEIQLNDSKQAVQLDAALQNTPLPTRDGIRAQQEIYGMLKAAHLKHEHS